MTATSQGRTLPVWQFHALALVALALGGLFVVVWWPAHYPNESDLVKFSGNIARMVVRDDISNTTAGSILPTLTSTYFRLEGVEGEFRYPGSHPKNLAIRNRVGVAIDVWVERGSIGGIEPMIIWQIREHNPFKKDDPDLMGEEIFVSHAEITEQLGEVDRSTFQVGLGLLAAGCAFALLGVGARRWNQRRAEGRI